MTSPEPTLSRRADLIDDGRMGHAALPTGAVTLLMTDVEGSTRLWERGEATATRVLARHHELLTTIIDGHGGVRPIEQGEGDSVLAAFEKPSDAVAAALQIQLALHREPWPDESPVRIRMAVHTGEIALRGDRNYQGPTIIRCARLRNVAHGGQTVISTATRDVVIDALPEQTSLLDLGAHRLKDLGRAERVWQLCHPELDHDFPPLRSLDLRPNNLPVQLTSFVGRGEELVELATALDAHRLVTLTGSGGSGKTRLALHVAADAAERYEGVSWVELAAVRDADRVVGTVATAIGLQEEHDRPVIETLTEQLRERRLLLVLDNCEQVVDATARMLHTLLAELPDLTVIVTSREPLGVPGELTWRVPSLADRAAIELFVERASRARAGFTPDPDQLDAIARICRRLDGLPLGIELAAARVRMMQPSRIASGLDDRFRLLTGGSQTAMPRQRTLEASVAWSHDLLDDREQMALRRLSVFEDGFTLEAAEAVVADGGVLDEYAVLDLVARLVDKSLVHLEDDGADTRYRFLETIRQYARERLAESGESDATRDRHLHHFLSRAESAAPALAARNGPALLAQLETEHDNLRAALDWADTTGQHESMLRLTTALTLFWEMRGYLAEGGRYFARALEGDTTPSTPSVELARAHWGAAHVALYQDEFDLAYARASDALAMAEAVGDEWTQARALNSIGYSRLWMDPQSERQTLERSIALGRSINDEWAVADGLKMMTIVWMIQDDHVALAEAVRELELDANRLHNDFFLAWCHACRGFTAMRQGRFDESRLEFERSLQLCRLVGDPATASMSTTWTADLEVQTGDAAIARERLDAFMTRANATGGHMGIGNAWIGLATILLATGEAEPAAGLAAAVAPEFGVPVLKGWALTIHGAAAIETGRTADARAALDAATAALGQVDNAWLVALIDEQRGRLARAEGDTSEAEALHHSALARRMQCGLRPGVVDSLEALATLALDHESVEEAARILGAATTLRADLGSVRWSGAQAQYDEDVARARAELGEEQLAAFWAEGVALSLDDAVAYISRARGERKRPSSGWASLTPTETRVVALASEGLTNRQIAERLFVAPGTVKVHLGHIFGKLGVATRAELASEATRRSIRA